MPSPPQQRLDVSAARPSSARPGHDRLLRTAKLVLRSRPAPRRAALPGRRSAAPPGLLAVQQLTEGVLPCRHREAGGQILATPPAPFLRPRGPQPVLQCDQAAWPTQAGTACSVSRWSRAAAGAILPSPPSFMLATRSSAQQVRTVSSSPRLRWPAMWCPERTPQVALCPRQGLQVGQTVARQVTAARSRRRPRARCWPAWCRSPVRPRHWATRRSRPTSASRTLRHGLHADAGGADAGAVLPRRGDRRSVDRARSRASGPAGTDQWDDDELSPL